MTRSGNQVRINASLFINVFLFIDLPPDVAFLLVGILDRDDWDAGHIFPVNQLGVVISGKHVRTLPTASRSFDLIKAKMILTRIGDFTETNLISFDPTLCPLPLLFPRGLVAGVFLNVHRPPPGRFRLRSRDLAEVKTMTNKIFA